jgi:hypothetical protein
MVKMGRLIERFSLISEEKNKQMRGEEKKWHGACTMLNSDSFLKQTLKWLG